MRPETIRLTNDEWTAVAAALRDADEAIRTCPPPAHSLRGRMQRLFGRPQPVAAPDARADLVRRFVVSTRYQRQAPDDLVPDLLSQGFNRAQIAALSLFAA